ncbi:hypothetical protein B0H63DRAFT_46132 [Podospora didyma]|uniref:Uncharacterized protein n=1 Tax=Podospora didyma TaxID=330526 RepID=A0AAE0U885_9PEZI|nr:hypothetical protein B0H63DRAFT_46132 [Podospora didyma]
MENDPPPTSVQDDGRGSKRGRIMGKLFGRDRDRERKIAQDDGPNSGDLNDFLRGSSDTLQVAHAEPPPRLAKLDIRSATRYPNALHVDAPGDLQQDPAYRPRSHSPRNRIRKKGLVVRFVDTYPDIIGDGGDECEVPTFEISRRHKPTRPPVVTAATAPARPTITGDSSQTRMPDPRTNDGPFAPGPLRRTQTGYSTISDTPEPAIPVERSTSARYLEAMNDVNDERRRSFIEVHQAEMREAEGLAFAQAVRSGSTSEDSSRNLAIMPSPPTPESAVEGVFTDLPRPGKSTQDRPLPPKPPSRATASVSPQPQFAQPGLAIRPPIQFRDSFQNSQRSPVPPPTQERQLHPSQDHKLQTSQSTDSPERLKRTPVIEQQSPSSTYSTSSSNFNHPYGVLKQGSRNLERSNGSPTSSPRVSSNLHDVVVAAADDAMDAFVARTRHLFELFRLYSETVRPLAACSLHELGRASLWWFLIGRMALEVTIREQPTTPEAQKSNDLAKDQAYADLAKAYWLSEIIVPEISGNKRIPIDADIEESRYALTSNLRKLAVSMKRNGFLPPEEAVLPQAINRSIWIEYPQITHDIKSLLWGSSSSTLAQTQPTAPGMSISEALPLADSAFSFCFGRFTTDVILTEQGRDSQRLYFPCILSITRPQKQPDIVFVVASQDGTIQLRISGNKNLGPIWDDVRWRSDTCTLDVRLPRGLILVVQCSPQNYKMIWNMYEFSAKVNSSLYPRQDEQCIFRSTLRTFQYFDNDPQARQFPREPTPNCDIALFERVSREGAAAGPRNHHRGYRIAVVTGPKTKTLSGVSQTYTPQAPIQFGFLRSEANDPALSLKFESGRLKGNMVLSFGDEQERLRMHDLLIGTALRRDEQVYCEVPLQGVWFSERFGDANQKGLKVISALPWQKLRAINHENDGDRPSCILSDKLRVIFEFKDGTFTDRINVTPGELKLRLDVHNPSCMMIFRQAQDDATLACTEAKFSRDLCEGLREGLETLQQSATIRTLMFASVADLHAFQTAITGYKVLFDGIASAFAISRRRMVVPIHKKWEAGATRVQVVQQDGVTQMLAFFDEFSHGKCLGFSLKGTDVFESFSRGGKAGLKIDDAKFPLPKVLPTEDGSALGAAESAFLCLDLPELPGEHDDITILFDNETEQQKLISCLPAPVKGSRLSKIKGLS